MNQDTYGYQNIMIQTILMTLLTQLITKMEAIDLKQMVNHLRQFSLYSLFIRYHEITLKGERVRSVCNWSGEASFTPSYSNTFAALWQYLMNKKSVKHNIFEVTELNNSTSHKINMEHNPMYYVSQSSTFLIDENLKLYGSVSIRNEKNETKSGSNSETQHFIIRVYSYVSTIDVIKEFLNDLTQRYLKTLCHKRENKQFIYSIKQISYEDSYLRECWLENEFETTRSFDNLFFDGKDKLLTKVDFFLNNKDWYYQKGLPYTLGLGLSGEPGTGKTSIIKALAKYTNRHIVNLSMKLFKTRNDLYKFYFESTYNRDNVDGSIGFDKKLVVIEDIDCLGDIVLQRDKNQMNQNIVKIPTINKVSSLEDGEIEKNKTAMKSVLKNEDPITLDDILNLWDGIFENTGRILIITSNHYDKLDKAITRPGRIDIRLDMKKLSAKTICMIYNHLYNRTVPKQWKNKLPDYQFTAANVMNTFLNFQNDHISFLKHMIHSPKNNID